MSVLYILGNGFDLYHGLPTRYEDYKRFLSDKHPWTQSGYANFNYLDINGEGERWSNVEKALHIDYSSLISDFIEEGFPSLSSNCQRWNDALAEMDEATRFIYEFTGEAYAEWISSVDICAVSQKLQLDRNGRFITFNYTSTLESVYSIDSNNILHVHGNIDDLDPECLIPVDYEVTYPAFIPDDVDAPDLVFRKDEPNNAYVKEIIQFGNPTLSPTELRSLLEKELVNKGRYETAISQCVNKAISCSESAYKNIAANYPNVAEFLHNTDIETVIVFGHSYDGVDMPYYQDVFAPLLSDRRWVFWSRRPSEEQDRITNFCNRLGFSNYSIKGVGRL